MGRRITNQELHDYAYRAGWRGEDLVTALAVAHAESGLEVDAISSTRCCYGVWQINARAHNESPARLVDPQYNANVAYRIQKRDGWRPWQAYTNGSYRAFLPLARQLVAGPAADTGVLNPGLSNDSLVGSIGGQVLGTVGGWLRELFTSKVWLRVGFAIGGGVLVITGLAMIAKDLVLETAVGQTVGKAVKAVANA